MEITIVPKLDRDYIRMEVEHTRTHSFKHDAQSTLESRISILAIGIRSLISKCWQSTSILRRYIELVSEFSREAAARWLCGPTLAQLVAYASSVTHRKAMAMGEGRTGIPRAP